MSETNKKKKTATAVVATAVAAAVLLSGTYAWQNLNQEALNVASDTVNPGGRLHDDFNGRNKDVYVENFADQQIFARIQLTEYMEKGADAGLNLDSEEERNVEVITGVDYNNRASWPIHYYEGGNATDTYWTWDYEGETVYMPTFNMNQDSVVADINGTYEGLSDEDEIHYDDYVKYAVGDTETGTEVRDADDDSDDEGDSAVEGTNITTTENSVHTAKATESAKVISMAGWQELTEEEKQETAYWVYDTDGWAYYSRPIEPKTATGLLLDGIELTGYVGDNWYYAINVIAQFITADDIGVDDNTGFYNAEKGTAPTDEALELLSSIGVTVTKEIPLSLPEDFVSVGAYGSDNDEVIVTLGDGWTNADVDWNISTGNGGGAIRASLVAGEENENTVTVQHDNYNVCGGTGPVIVTVTAKDGSASGSIEIPFNCH